MLNSSTINTLNRLGFGVNIDKIESYIHYFKQANLVADLSKYEYNYLKLVKILKEIKPNSKVLTEDIDYDGLKTDEFDKLFTTYGNEKCVVAYGKDDEHKINSVKSVNFEEDYCMDLVAVNNVEGIDIMCTYINGRVYRVYAIGEYTKHFDFTEQLKDKVPSFIEDIACHRLVEFRGKATIFKDKEKRYDNIACSTLYLLQNNIGRDCVDIVFNDVIFEEDNNTFKSIWDKLEWMRDIGLNVPHHALIRNVDRVQFESALEEFDEYFRNEENNSIVYSKLGFNIKNNNDIETSEYIICYDTNNVEHKSVFEAIVKDITIDIDRSFIKIVSTKCNNGIIIDTIDIDDIYDIEKYNIAIGNKIYFNVVEGEAILSCK